MTLHEDIFRKTLNHFLKPISAFLDDPTVSEVMINGPSEIYIERAGRLIKTDAKFASDLALLAAAKNIAQFTGKRVNRESPRVDARLPDGSRVHIVTAPASRRGLSIAIRKFSRDVLTAEKLVGYGAIAPAMVEYLQIAILGEKNVLVSGGTGSGKTSLLNALSAFIPSHDRVIVLEDSSELQLQQDHVLYFEVQPADRYGKYGVSIRDLFHSALRLRPDRIIIGEIRGGEALDLIQAMTSGHGGCMSTNHANAPEDALRRLETMALMSGVEMPLLALRSQIASAIDVVVQTSRVHDGSRKVTFVSEVLPLDEAGNYQLQHVFVFKSQGVDVNGKVLGQHYWTSRPSRFAAEVPAKGLRELVSLTRRVFGLTGDSTGESAP